MYFRSRFEGQPMQRGSMLMVTMEYWASNSTARTSWSNPLTHSSTMKSSPRIMRSLAQARKMGELSPSQPSLLPRVLQS
eukprot:8104511-Alexandrium_andersonii.AAC.1